VDEPVKAGVPSDPFLLAGFAKRGLFLGHDGAAETTFALEIDRAGDGHWTPLQKAVVPAKRAGQWLEFPAEAPGVWIRVTSDREQTKATAQFQFAAADTRTTGRDPLFTGLAEAQATTRQGAFLLTRGGNLRTRSVLTADVAATGTKLGAAYELTAELKLVKQTDPKVADYVAKNTPIPAGVLSVDAASVVFTEAGRRWRLPRAGTQDAAQDALLQAGALRKAREVCTERDLLQAHGTFYELPALNAGGAIRLRPVATSDLAVHDYCSYRGLLVLSGIAPGAGATNRHVLRSEDGAAAVWVGAADDLWKLGKPRGHGGPWAKSAATADLPSDPYLMTGYDRKTLSLENHSDDTVRVTIELDAAGDGRFAPWRTFRLQAGERLHERLPDGLNAYWLRATSNRDAELTCQLTYE
jgi:hypothetical protein